MGDGRVGDGAFGEGGAEGPVWRGGIEEASMFAETGRKVMVKTQRY